MKTGLRRQLLRSAFLLTSGLLFVQVVLFAFVDLTDLHWPPSDWAWVIRGSIREWLADPQMLRHELREFLSLALIALASIPVVWFSFQGIARRIFGPLERIAGEAARISAGGGTGRLPVDAKEPDNEISTMARACNLAFDRYEESFQRLERFTRDASHQLRTPLATMRALGEVSLSTPRSPEAYRDTIGRMLEEADRLLNVVETLLDTARRDPRETRARFTRLDAAHVLHLVADHFQEWAEVKDVRLRLDAAAPAWVLGDAALLEQAVFNLTDNAFHHAPAGTTVTLRLRTDGAHACLEVADEGPGIDAGLRERLFKPFVRSPDSTYRGTGLGLVIVSDVARLHGGEAGVDSEPGRGSTFRIRIPLAG